MIFYNIYMMISEGLRDFFDILPDFKFVLPNDIASYIAQVLSVANYFLPISDLRWIFVTEFSLITISIFISFYKGLKEFK